MQKISKHRKTWTKPSSNRNTIKRNPSPKKGVVKLFFSSIQERIAGMMPSKLQESAKQKPTQKSSAQYKIFEPKKEDLFKEKVKQTIKIPKISSQKKQFSFGVKPSQYFKNINQLSPRTVFLNIKFTISKWRIAERINQFIFGSIFLFTAIFIVYLSLFDTLFLVKSYSISFDYSEKNQQYSYLDTVATKNLIENIKKQRFLGLVPSNQLWFLNSQNLTNVAQKSNPSVTNVSVERRIWPNNANLKITTEPILLTLGITLGNNTTNSEYWRIARDGEIMTSDDSGIREKLVVVEKSVQFNKSDKNLRDISFNSNAEQMDRFWFTLWLWDGLKEQNIPVVKTSYPSLFDNDVNIQLANGTILQFTNHTSSAEGQKLRIEQFFSNPTYRVQLDEGKFGYIDFRIPKRIFICNRGELCEKQGM
jgi:hypothetical protein